MKTDNDFEAPGENGAPPKRRSSKAKELAERRAAEWPALEQILQELPDSRGAAVARARQLIADWRYPTDEETELLARRLAIQLTTENDPLQN